MAKKSIIIIITAVTLSLVLAFGGAAYLYYSSKEKASEEVIAEHNEPGIDYKKAKTFSIEGVTITLRQTDSKPSYLKVKISITVKDEKTLKEVEELVDIIKDAILGVFETKSSHELAGNRNAMKEPLLEAIRGIFSKQEEKDGILAISIPEFFIQQ